MCVEDTSVPGCVGNRLMLRVLDGETENGVDGRNHGVRYSKTERVAIPQVLSLDFLTSTHSRGIGSRPPCCWVLFIVCCVGRRVYGCKRLDSVIFLPTSGIAKQHKRYRRKWPVSLSAENKLVVPECSGCLSHEAGDRLQPICPGWRALSLEPVQIWSAAYIYSEPRHCVAVTKRSGLVTWPYPKIIL